MMIHSSCVLSLCVCVRASLCLLMESLTHSLFFLLYDEYLFALCSPALLWWSLVRLLCLVPPKSPSLSVCLCLLMPCACSSLNLSLIPALLCLVSLVVPVIRALCAFPSQSPSLCVLLALSLSVCVLLPLSMLLLVLLSFLSDRRRATACSGSSWSSGLWWQASSCWWPASAARR